jgi:ribulose-phosphate 3-epimerase
VNQNLVDAVRAHGTATLAGSLLAAAPERRVDEARELTAARAWCHVDVMDGRFTPHKGLPVTTIRRLADAGCGPVDVHLMVADPLPVLESVLAYPPDRVTVHLESTNDPEALAQTIRDADCSPWLAISPRTAHEASVEHLAAFDGILIMLVQPGSRDTEADLGLLAKVRELRTHIPVGVDGGVTEANVAGCMRAGATYVVAGRSLLG